MTMTRTLPHAILPAHDIDALQACKAWTGLGKKKVTIVGWSPPGEMGFDPGFAKRFPKLTRLLKLARVTDFQTSPRRVNVRPKPDSFPNDHVIYRLWAWTTRSGRFAAWPASPISSVVAPTLSEVSDDHQLILRNLGAINWMGCCEPEELTAVNDNFALNQNFIFGTDRRTHTKLWVKAYEHDHRQDGGDARVSPHVDFSDPRWVCFAQEANGNELLYDRSHKDRVILVSGDHCFGYVHPSVLYQWRHESGGYRWDSLLDIAGVSSLRDWAERLACQWLAQID